MATTRSRRDGNTARVLQALPDPIAQPPPEPPPYERSLPDRLLADMTHLLVSEGSRERAASYASAP